MKSKVMMILIATSMLNGCGEFATAMDDPQVKASALALARSMSPPPRPVSTTTTCYTQPSPDGRSLITYCKQ